MSGKCKLLISFSFYLTDLASTDCKLAQEHCNQWTKKFSVMQALAVHLLADSYNFQLKYFRLQRLFLWLGIVSHDRNTENVPL